MLFCPQCKRHTIAEKTWDGAYWNYTCSKDGQILIRCPDYLTHLADELIAKKVA